MSHPMIARNYRRYPEALALQLVLPFHCVVVRRVRERHSGTARASGDTEHEDFPIGTIVALPSGKQARVIGYRGKRRQHAIRLVCRYLVPENRRYDVVQVLPKLARIVEEESRGT